MSNIFSNRFFQGGLALAAVGVAFFAYQNFTSESVDSEADAAASEAQVEAHQILAPEDAKVENAVNNTENSDIINTADEATTSQ